MGARKLRWGLLSTARINSAVIPPLRASPRNELVAVASRDLEKARAYAAEWEIPRVFGSYEAMLSDPDIDVIYNSLPNSMHREWTIRAIEAGKHVLCEKPLALTVEDVDAVADAAQQAGVVVAEAFMYRHHPQTLKVKELVASGTIGRLQLVRGSFTYTLRRTGDVRLDPALGGGSIWDVGCYPISYMRYVLDAEPEEVFGWQGDNEPGVDLFFAGQMRFPGGILAQFDSGLSITQRWVMEFAGDEGSLIVPSPFKPGLHEQILLQREDETLPLSVTGRDLYLGEIEDMADAVLLGKAPRISLADSRANVATIQALLQSDAEGRPVKM